MIDGAVIVDIRLNAAGSERITKQVVYISKMASRPYLNLDACRKLGLVSMSFPRVTVDNLRVNAIMDDDDDMQIDAFAVEEDNTCDCPVRVKAPDPPTELPFPTTEVGKLRDWIL